MKVTYLPIDNLIILPCVERKPDRVEDDKMRKSIEAGGIQQPFVVCPHEGRDYLIDGLTRLRIARVTGLEKVPTIADPKPDEIDIERHISRSRFIINFQRQDLLPSQEAECVEYFKRPPFEMTHKEIAKLLGWAPDSVTNALSIKSYIPAVAAAVDAGIITRHAARTFDGLSEKGQRVIWEKHQKELISTPGGVVHKQLRKQYSPTEHPDFFRQPKLIAQRLKRAGQRRRGNIRPDISAQEKIRLVQQFSFEEGELKMCQAEEQRYDRRRNGSIRAVRIMLRNPELREMLSPDMITQLEKWHEVYC